MAGLVSSVRAFRRGLVFPPDRFSSPLGVPTSPMRQDVAHSTRRQRSRHPPVAGPRDELLSDRFWWAQLRILDRGRSVPGRCPGPTVVKGIQSHRVMATTKHFAFNDEEVNRISLTSWRTSGRSVKFTCPPLRRRSSLRDTAVIMSAFNAVNAYENGALPPKASF